MWPEEKRKTGYSEPGNGSNTSTYADGEGNYFVIGSGTRRTFSKTEAAAREHAVNLIDNGSCDEFLIVKVVGVLKKAKPPTVYTKVK